jgi:hypothetical protein
VWAGLEGAAEGLRAFGHAGDSAAGAWIGSWPFRWCPGGRDRRCRDRGLVVDLDRQGVVGVAELDGGGAAGGVSGRVGERLLDYPVSGRADLRRQVTGLALLGEADGQAGGLGPGGPSRAVLRKRSCD